MVFTCQLESYFHENLPYTNFIFNDSKQAYIYVTINATQIVVVDYTFKLLLLSCEMHHIHFITYCCVYSRRRGRFFVVLLNIRPLWIAHTKKRYLMWKKWKYRKVFFFFCFLLLLFKANCVIGAGERHAKPQTWRTI